MTIASLEKRKARLRIQLDEMRKEFCLPSSFARTLVRYQDICAELKRQKELAKPPK